MSGRDIYVTQTHLTAMFPRLDNPACHDASIDPDLFFPESAEEYVATREAIRKICGGCPARETCLNFALDNQIPHGVWGGLNHVERIQLANRGRHSSENKQLMHQVRALMRRGFTPQQACSDVGISVRTFERWKSAERAEWQERQARRRAKLQEETNTEKDTE